MLFKKYFESFCVHSPAANIRPTCLVSFQVPTNFNVAYAAKDFVDMNRCSRMMAVLCHAASAFLIALPAHATLIEATFSLDAPDFTSEAFDPLEQLFANNNIDKYTGTASWDTAVVASRCPLGPLTISCAANYSAVDGTFFANNFDSLFGATAMFIGISATPTEPGGRLVGFDTRGWVIDIGTATYTLRFGGFERDWSVRRVVPEGTDGCSRVGCVTRGLADVKGLSFVQRAVPVPVPTTLAIFGLGLAGLGWTRRKKAYLKLFTPKP